MSFTRQSTLDTAALAFEQAEAGARAARGGRMKPLVVSLDLEMNQPSGRIIQVGAVLGHLVTGQVLSRFSVYVNPEEPLSERIAILCGIAPEVLEVAGTLHEAYAQLTAWLAPYAHERQLNPLTWGGGDSQTLREQLALEDECWLFGRRWLDVKTVYAALRQAQGLPHEGGLGTSMKKLGLVFEGRKHDAADDALNTFRVYAKLLASMRAGLAA